MATEQLLPSTTDRAELNCVSVSNLEMRRAVAAVEDGGYEYCVVAQEN